MANEQPRFDKVVLPDGTQVVTLMKPKEASKQDGDTATKPEAKTV
jgi:hypothetical protein